MYTIWVITLSLGIVSADVGLGYHYKVPETSYGVPSYQIGGSGYNTGAANLGTTNTGFGFGSSTTGPGFTAGAGNTNTGFTGTSSNVGGYESGFSTATAGSGGGFNYNPQGTAGSSGSGFNYNGVGTGSGNHAVYQETLGPNIPLGLDGYYQTGGASSVASSGVNYQPSYTTGSGLFNQQQTLNHQYQTSAVQKYQEYYNQIVQQPPQVYKHFYVHAAPEEPELPRPRKPIVLPPPQKHYKIIFIKTPSQPAPAPQIIPIQSQNEEKTIVYVLVKKPEDAQDVAIPKFEQKPPAKPEVFFIKYNNKHDSERVITDIVNGFNKEGVSTTFAGDYSGSKVSGSTDNAGVFSSTSGLNGATSIDGVSGIGASGGSYTASSPSPSAEHAFGGVLGQTESQSSGSFGSQYTSGPAFGATGSSTSSGFESTFGTLGSGISSTASTFGPGSGYDASAISTSQGVPHESYGPPKFKEY